MYRVCLSGCLKKLFDRVRQYRLRSRAGDIKFLVSLFLEAPLL